MYNCMYDSNYNRAYWSYKVKELLFISGLGNIWLENHSSTAPKPCSFPFIKTGLEDIEKQLWIGTLFDDKRTNSQGNKLRT